MAMFPSSQKTYQATRAAQNKDALIHKYRKTKVSTFQTSIGAYRYMHDIIMYYAIENTNIFMYLNSDATTITQHVCAFLYNYLYNTRQTVYSERILRWILNILDSRYFETWRILPPPYEEIEDYHYKHARLHLMEQVYIACNDACFAMIQEANGSDEMKDKVLLM
jgi:hypothetical protein